MCTYRYSVRLVCVADRAEEENDEEEESKSNLDTTAITPTPASIEIGRRLRLREDRLGPGNEVGKKVLSSQPRSQGVLTSRATNSLWGRDCFLPPRRFPPPHGLQRRLQLGLLIKVSKTGTYIFKRK